MDMAFSDSRAIESYDIPGVRRPLGWSELCARLVAAQDLRRLQSGADIRPGVTAGGTATGGSFHLAAAHMLEHHGAPQGFVNSTSSVNRKDNQGTSSGSRENPLTEYAQRQADENCHD